MWEFFMNQKMEDILNLALETPEEVRERTDTLNIGFDGAARTWELIVKYQGSLEDWKPLGVAVEYLIAGYAILTVPEHLVERVAQAEQIEYVEKPKRYYYQNVRPAQESCIPQTVLQEPYLSGKNVLIAILDSGIAYYLPVFQKADGSTRIRFLWDQSLQKEFTEEDINRALAATDGREQYEILQSRDVTGHGTAVAGIAAGSRVAGAAGNGGYSGVAPEADLLAVKLGNPGGLGFPRTTEIMRGVVYALRKAEELQMPLVINLSFGNSYGSHDGSSLLERFLDNAAEIGRTVICVGSGNEGSAGGHMSGNVAENTAVELAVARYETSINIQIWKNYNDVYRIYLRSPGGYTAEISPAVRGGIGGRQSGKYVLRMERTEILVYWGEPAPYSVAQEIYLDMMPVGQPYVDSGVWTILIEPVRVVTGQYYLYLPGSAVRNEQTGFYKPTPQVTLTIPSTAAKVLTVGAYDSTYDTYADFSGRGYADARRTIGVVTAGLIKPDIVAPGVGILAPDVSGNYAPLSGTSFATPIASGSAALLMEWGIVRGNDPFLYGEKVKAYLRKGARVLRGEREVPNDRVGYGALCVRASLPW